MLSYTKETLFTRNVRLAYKAGRNAQLGHYWYNNKSIALFSLVKHKQFDHYSDNITGIGCVFNICQILVKTA